jgi:alkylation response protein AidB-like acyl-CoA dehydrogenase
MVGCTPGFGIAAPPVLVGGIVVVFSDPRAVFSATGASVTADPMADADELELLRSTVGAALRRGGGLPELGELGLLGLLVPEAVGGAGWRPVEAATVAIELGRSVGDQGAEHGAGTRRGAPWLEVSVAAMALAAGSEELRRDWLAPLLAGHRTAVIADGVLDGAGALTGAATGVVGAPDAIVVEVGDRHVLVPRATGGVDVRPDPASIDVALPAETWTLQGVTPLELPGADSHPVELSDVRRVLAAASLSGILSAALGRLVPYLSEREAFGAHIASFQAIQHRIVDVFLLEVRSRITVEAAARALAARSDDAPRLAATAHGLVAAQVPAALDDCIQLTGGIGFTWEYPLHHELRRAVALAAACGGARASRRRFTRAGAAHA